MKVSQMETPENAVFFFLALWFHPLKKVVQTKWNDLISRQAADKSTPPSAEGPWGLGDWRWMLRFRTTT